MEIKSKGATMKQLLKTKSFIVGAVAILGGVALLVFTQDNKEISVLMITTGLGTITLRDAIRKGQK